MAKVRTHQQQYQKVLTLSTSQPTVNTTDPLLYLLGKLSPEDKLKAALFLAKELF